MQLGSASCDVDAQARVSKPPIRRGATTIRLWASRGSHTDTRLRRNTRGRDGGVREELAAGIGRVLINAQIAAFYRPFTSVVQKIALTARWLWPRNCDRGPTAKPLCIAFTRRCSAPSHPRRGDDRVSGTDADRHDDIYHNGISGFGGNADRAEMADLRPRTQTHRSLQALMSQRRVAAMSPPCHVPGTKYRRGC
jgi:hypothetical protein